MASRDRTHRGILLPALALCLGMHVPAARALTLEVGIYDQKPDVYIARDGRPAGILGELLNEIARQEGWKIRTQACAWEECMRLLAEGRIDLLPDVYYTLERAETFGLHHVPALHSWSQVYARPGQALRSIQDLGGRSIAVLAGSTQQDYLKTTFSGLDIDARADAVQNLESGFQRVQSGLSDAVAADFYIGGMLAHTYQLVATPIVFQPTQAYYAMPKGRHPEVLAAIDRHLSAWQADPESFYYRTLDGWRLPQSLSLLGRHGVWIIAGLSALLALTLAITLLLRIQMSRQRQRLRRTERRLDAILDAIDASVSIKDLDFRYTFANRKHEEFLGVAEGRLIGLRDDDTLKDADSLASIHRNDQAVVDTRERSVSQMTIRPPHGEPRTFLAIKAPMRGPDGALEAICTVSTDITERLRAEETAHHLAVYDTLTGLPNRRTALAHLAQMIESARQGRSIGALLLIDLDGFKRINDMQGHATGDEVLCGIADRLRTSVRDRDLVSRVSADEFVVLLDGLGGNVNDAARNAMHVGEKVRLAICNSAFSIQSRPAYVTASIGLTLIQADSQTTDTVMREADMATHRAKQHGGNQVTFYEEGLQSEVEQRLWLEQDLLQAIGTPVLTLHVQPQFGHDGRVTGGELLARWTHPTRGPVSPALFIPIAEETGLISLLGAWSLQFACDALLALRELGETYPLSLNVSPRQLMEAQFTEYVRDTLESKGVPGNRLIFEITEGVLIQDMQAVARRMQALSLLGIRFSIDDFGTGYSNLAYLKRLPLYELKIDKSLVQDIPNDSDSIAIVQLILAMADQLNLRVVAEGVETEAQSRFLFEHDCHALQGYLLARPMPLEAWLDVVRTRRRHEAGGPA
ncbi:EAL domain-containing protein [Castellaniella defragrans]|uniref:Diguanylate cyclase (GGDEF)-like protein/PAS domain S-box-containing protein n=1 Tax=Castellaniella defragrans TaxID=75697 RepID=A0A7W9WM41_CASDE|nr:EAL domain-containing protein [Castellaniella defragrans]KAB0622660.1 EAL domain-containing protein [Castellaniella defragrans]MBB6082009.1 diguanylate cyclase (GGDEF)-like protein/PAS domain S-box-containing protein [Castellaniella defragrans]